MNLNSQSTNYNILGSMTFFFNYSLFNYRTIKIDTRKIKHQPNIETFVWHHDNPIKQNKINYED